MEQNKTGKYFKYAIGEIILVVIGILIALQINNWNEHRKLKVKADIYVNKIINDLKVDTLNINKLIEKTEEYSQNIDNYYEYFNSKDSLNISIEKLIDSINKLDIRFLKYFPVNKTFKDMESSGSSDLLLDTQRDFLIKLASNQLEFEIINESYLDIAVAENQKSQQHLGDTSSFYKKLKIENSKERQIQGLLHRHLYLNALKDLYFYVKVKGENINKLSLEATELLLNNN